MSQARRTTIWNVQGATREKMVADGGRWKEQRSTGKTINYQEKFRKQLGFVRLFLLGSKADFCDQFRKGWVSNRRDRKRNQKYNRKREKERVRERNEKRISATLPKLLEKFSVLNDQTSSFSLFHCDPTSFTNELRNHATLQARELIRVPYFARLRRPSNINRQLR